MSSTLSPYVPLDIAKLAQTLLEALYFTRIASRRAGPYPADAWHGPAGEREYSAGRGRDPGKLEGGQLDRLGTRKKPLANSNLAAITALLGEKLCSQR